MPLSSPWACDPGDPRTPCCGVVFGVSPLESRFGESLASELGARLLYE